MKKYRTLQIFGLLWFFLSLSMVGCSGVPQGAVEHKAQVRVVIGPPYASGLDPIQSHVQPTTTGTYHVQPGDTLWAIAVAHTVDPEALARWNHIDNPERLLVGQGLRVQDPDRASPPSPVHVAAVQEATIEKRPTRSPAIEKAIAQEAALQTPPHVSRPAVSHAARSAPAVTPLTNRTPAREKKAESSHRSPRRKPLTASRKNQFLASGKPKRWLWPLKGRIIGKFRSEGRHRNPGIDIAARMGAPVRATADGIVAYADNAVASYGKLILLRHGGSYMSAYAHNDEILVRRGDFVRAGDLISLAGRSGRVDSPRLHFELRRRVTPLNPLHHLPKRRKKG